MVETPAEYATITKRVNEGCDGSGIAPDAGCVKTGSSYVAPQKREPEQVKKLVKEHLYKGRKNSCSVQTHEQSGVLKPKWQWPMRDDIAEI
jgi:hypothetical protein